MYFYLKKPKLDKPTPIDIMYYLKFEKKNFKYSTKQKIHPEDWDFSSRYPKLKRGSLGKKNKQISLILDNYKTLLESTIYEYSLKNQPLTRDALKNIFEQKFNPKYKTTTKDLPVVIIDAIDLFLEKKKSTGGVTRDWLNKYSNLKNKITLFDTYQKKTSFFNDLNENWLDAYCGFLRNFPKLVDEKKAKEIKSKISKEGYNNNSLHRHIKLLIAFLNWATSNYEIKINILKNPIRGYETDDIHLTNEEINKIENVILDKPSLKKARDIFLIGVYSGQRFSDYSVFEKADVQNNMIIKKSEKTETESFIPLHNKLKILLDKYNWKLPIISGQKFNPHIKKICKKADINYKVKKITYRGNSKVLKYYEKWELVSSHTARRTFITLSSEKGMPDHIIMAITGIRDIKTLTKYKKTNQNTVKDFMNKIWG